MAVAKTIFRTLFYQFFLLFVGLSIGFILNAEWVGIKSIILHRSMRNIFYPLKYDEHLDKVIKEIGGYRVYISKDCPDEFEIIDETVYSNEEWYWCRYKYRDKHGKIRFDEGTNRVKWKTWEYYYETDFLLDTPKNIKEQIEKDKNDAEKRIEEKRRARERERQILEEERRRGL